jgi:hypothetical protein
MTGRKEKKRVITKLAEGASRLILRLIDGGQQGSEAWHL